MALAVLSNSGTVSYTHLGLCSGEDAWSTKAVERLGIPAVKVSDGPHGLRVQCENDNNLFREAQEAVCFPNGCALAASFDKDLIKQVGDAIGREAQALGSQTVLGPAVNQCQLVKLIGYSIYEGLTKILKFCIIFQNST